MTKEKAITLNYLYFLRANKIQHMAIETEYDGKYHIHVYKLSDVIAFIESLQGDEIMQLMRYKDGFRCRPFTCGGYTSTRKPRNKILHHFIMELLMFFIDFYTFFRWTDKNNSSVTFAPPTH